MDPRYSFLDQEPPPGYVAGIGRGATGFTTQLDVGGPRLSFNDLQEEEDDDDEDKEKYADADEGLLAANGKGYEDEEADKIYEEIELRLRNRRKRKVDEVEDDTKETDLISEQFQDLKKALVTVSETEWLNLPEVGDLTKRNKRLRDLQQLEQRFYAVPDSVTTGLTNDDRLDSVTDFKSINQAKESLLMNQLDSGSQLETIDSEEYLKSLAGFQVENVANINKAKLIFKNLRKTEPKDPLGWISGARLEESVRRMEEAKKIIEEGCTVNPLSTDLWLENLRLNPKNSKSIITRLLTFQPKSVKLWTAAYELENDTFTQRRILRKLLENIPTSVELWNAAINLEETQDKKKLLLTLTQLTNSIELWIQLIDLEKDVNQAKVYLNDARKLNPDSFDIWVHAAKLEEKTTGNEVKVEKLLTKGIAKIALTRDEYMSKAVTLETDGYPITCSVILRNVLDLNMQDLDDSTQIKLWIQDAKMAIDKNLIESAKVIYEYIINKFPHHISTWRQFIRFVKKYKPDELLIYFEQLIDKNPKIELFWLWFAKEYMTAKEFTKSRSILTQAMEVLSENEDILFALIKLEKTATGDTEKMKQLYVKGLEDIGTVRIYYKYATFLRTLGENEKALQVVEDAIAKFPDCFKLYLQASQILQDQNDSVRAKDILHQGVQEIPNSVEIWLLYSAIESSVLKKAAILDKATLLNSKSSLLWRAKFQFEFTQNAKAAHTTLLKLKQIIPNSPELWAVDLMNLERKSFQKTAFRKAMEETNNNPLVLNTIGLLLWQDGKISRCKNFFDESINLNKDIGDSWVLLYAFLKRHGDSDELEKLVRDIEDADPHHGEMWCSVTKRIDMLDKTKSEWLEEALKAYAM